MGSSRRRPPSIEVLDQSFEDWYEVHADQYRNLAGVRRHLNDRFGKGQWGDDEFTQYMRELYDDDIEQARTMQRREEQAEFPSVDSATAVEERVAAYMDFFENLAPNDIVAIRTMATLEVAIEQAREQWQATLEAEQPSRAAAKGWSDMMRNMSREHRLVQEVLGINRPVREREDKDADQVLYVRDVMRRAAAFTREHAVQIRCPHCMAEEAQVEINMGFVLFHFRDDAPWMFVCKCPRCGGEVRLGEKAN